jgi:hypothetical protein
MMGAPLPESVYNTVFVKSRDGEEVLAELCRLFYDRPSYEKGDAMHTAFREGQRSTVAFILRKTAIIAEEETDGA